MIGVEKPLTKEELRKLQLLELDILKEVDRICRKHNITYTIAGGTLLGAVRHGGFIPWDDDVDITMLRKDYERFFEICKTELESKYYAQRLETDKNYRWAYGRILLNGTSYIRVNQEHLKAQTGVFIDIIPCDSLSDNIFIRKLQRNLAFVMRKILYSPVGAVTFKGTISGRIFYLLSLISRKIPELIWKIILILSPNENTEYVEYYGLMTLREETKRKLGKKDFKQRKRQLNKSSSLREHLLFDSKTGGIKREWYTRTEDILFEGFYVKTVSDFDGWLSFEYGDYMKLPPEEKRKPLQTVSEFSFGEYK